VTRKALPVTLAILMAGAMPAAAMENIDFFPVETAARPYTIYMVQWRGQTPTDDGFRDYLSSQGISARYIVRNADQNMAALESVAAEINAVKPDLVYTWSLAAAQGILGTMEAVARTPEKFVTDIPVVACAVSDPVQAELAQTWQTSARNFTSVSHVPPMKAQVNAMKMYDDIARIAVLYNPAEQSPVAAVASLRELAKQEGFELLEFPVPLDADSQPRADALPDLIARVAKAKPNFLYLGPDTFLARNRQVVTQEANRLRVPVFGAAEVFVRESGGLVGLVSRYYNVGQYCGYKAKEILAKGRSPKDIPNDTLKKFSYIVNKRTAERLQYYPPLSIVNFIEVVDAE